MPMLKMIPVMCPVRAPRSGRRSSSAALPTTTAVPTEAPWMKRPMKRAGSPDAVMKTTSPDEHADRGADEQRLAAEPVRGLAGDEHGAEGAERVDGEDQGGGDRGEAPPLGVQAVERGGRARDAQRDREEGDEQRVGPGLVGVCRSGRERDA